ncbi:MAG: cold shock domain-containing protein [Gallionellaceae bacterium]|nr:cold shock domain-containing protein [Gallionellaceae bacterium]
MEGVIKTFLSDKKYGFIKGDDGKDYYFRADSFKNKAAIENICDGALVVFDTVASPKGYRAVGCSLVEQSGVTTYVTPSEFMFSKSNNLKGWDIVERGDWIVCGTSRDSPDSAKSQMAYNARSLGANALLDVEYFKTTGSEQGTGQGTYQYTIHNYKGRIAMAAKKSLSGEFKLEALIGINKRAVAIKDECLRAKQQSDLEKKKYFTWLGFVSIPTLLISAVLNVEVSLFLLAGFFVVWVLIYNDKTDRAEWLQRSVVVELSY